MQKSIALPQKILRHTPFIRSFIWGYFFFIILGWLLLRLPFSTKIFITKLDTLFTIASAISTTGLVTVDIGETFSFYGQIVLLFLIQLGGIGYLLFSSFIILNLQQTLLDFRRKATLPTSCSSSNFSMAELTKQVISYTLICELSGLIILFFFFRNEGMPFPLWNASFHSISAFCTTGLSLFHSNLEGYKHHLGVNVTISLLSLLGAWGFFPGMKFLKTIAPPISRQILRLLSRMIRSFATVMISFSILFFLVMTNCIKANYGFESLLITSFQVVSAITTSGFNTIDIRILPQTTHFFLIFLMLFGVALTGSGTYTRNTSLSVVMRLMRKILDTKKRNSQWIQKILLKRIQIATSTLAYYLFVLLISCTLLVLLEKQAFLPLLFEAASALSTVGLSMGITRELSMLGKSIMILLMLGGRIGILIYGFSLSKKKLSRVHNKHYVAIF